ncbi:MAG: 50S ribosomal protein L3, partial [Bacteroidetes bacterium]|nr:50S ribosomal protein L3 [Bacteroidota bacterium]
VVTQIKSKAKDGYDAVQIGYGTKKEKNTTKALKGHFEKAQTAPKSKLVEFRGTFDVELGAVVSTDILKEGDKISISANSKGKGFQGVVKRHNFSGVGGQTHGQHNRLRSPGSIGACSTPSRVFKGMKMGGRMGNETVKLPGSKIIKIIPEQNYIIVKGSVPGHNGAIVVLEKK